MALEQTGNSTQHLMIWGSTREGMSVMSTIAKAALLENGTVILVTRGAMVNDSLPPGFTRFLSEEEMLERGLHFLIHDLAARVGRKWNAGRTASQEAAAPYYRQFDKRRF